MDGVSLPTSLEHARVTSLPSTSYYIPNFISEEEERIILDKVRLVTPFFKTPLPNLCLRSPLLLNQDGSSLLIADFKHGLPILFRTNYLMPLCLTGFRILS